MNAGIILGAQQPDPVGSLARGQAARAQADQFANQNALRNLYQTQGANIMAGDSNALNALAQFDPQQALTIQGSQQQMSQSRAAHDQQMAQRSQAMKMQVEKYAQTLTKEQREAEAAQIEQGITRAISLYQAGNLDGVNQILQSVGEQPLESLEQFPAVAALYGDALSTLKSVTDLTAPDKPADEYGRYVAEETAAGRTPMSRIEYKRAGKTTQKINVAPDGSVSVVEGFGEGNLPKTTEGEKSSAGYLSRMRAAENTLDELSVEEPAVRSITSLLAGGSNFEGIVLDERQERILQAQRDWVRAKLRKESGAVIGPEEMAEEIRTYFPLPGEGESVIEQKRQSRKQAERQFEIMSGAASPQAQQPTDSGGPNSQPSFEFQNDQQRLLFEKYSVPSE
jgi:hypothetical protein